jgi:hypothetical protein
VLDIDSFKKQLEVHHLIHEDYKYAAMDWDRTWWVYTHKPNCVDDMWDSKEGRSEKIANRAIDKIDWRSSLVEVGMAVKRSEISNMKLL